MANRVFPYLKTTAPTVNDDTGDGYKVGDEWLDTTNDIMYKAIDVTLGGAIWVELVGRTQTQTLTNKTLTSPTINTPTIASPTITSPVITAPQINDTSSDHQYVFAVNELAANRTVTMPLLLGNDVFVFADFIQTLTNKTLTSPTINSPTITNFVTNICDARLTLTSGTPVTTADVTGATNIYVAPYKGNRIALYDGSANWNVRSFTEITIALGTLTSGLPYDIFVYDNAGTVTARSPVAWTNGTTRATALTTQNGVLVKTGATTDRYLGTFYTTATTTTEDSLAKRYLWNYYNRVLRPMRVIETTNSWTYTTAAFRAMNNSTANSLQTVIGWSEDAFNAKVIATCAPSTGNPYRVVGIGVGSTTVNSAQLLAGVITGGKEHAIAQYNAIPAVGYQYYQALEYSEATGTVTWYGDDGGSIISSGIMGEVFA